MTLFDLLWRWFALNTCTSFLCYASHSITFSLKTREGLTHLSAVPPTSRRLCPSLSSRQRSTQFRQKLPLVARRSYCYLLFKTQGRNIWGQLETQRPRRLDNSTIQNAKGETNFAAFKCISVIVLHYFTYLQASVNNCSFFNPCLVSCSCPAIYTVGQILGRNNIIISQICYVTT